MQDNECHYCRVRAAPVELDEYGQSKTLPLTIGFRAILYLNTLHILVEPVPCHTLYYLFSAFAHSCIVTPPHPVSSCCCYRRPLLRGLAGSCPPRLCAISP